MTVIPINAAQGWTLGGSEAIAWAAGLFEGEGSFYGNNVRLRASVVMTDEAVVRRFAEVVGCGVVYARYDRRATKTGPPRLPSWKWEASSVADFGRIVDLFRPYLGERRLARADELLKGRTDYMLAATAERPCPVCERLFRPPWTGGRRKLYCSNRCKGDAYIARRRAS